jgi:hypothetical protein
VRSGTGLPAAEIGPSQHDCECGKGSDAGCYEDQIADWHGSLHLVDDGTLAGSCRGALILINEFEGVRE